MSYPVLSQLVALVRPHLLDIAFVCFLLLVRYLAEGNIRYVEHAVGLNVRFRQEPYQFVADKPVSACAHD